MPFDFHRASFGIAPVTDWGMAKHKFMLQAKNESGAVVGVRCIICGTIALYEDGKVPDAILSECTPPDSSQNALRVVREATEGK